jgi:dihydroorotase
MNILIKSAKIIDPNSPFNRVIKDILIQNGIVTRIEDSNRCRKTLQSFKKIIFTFLQDCFDMRCNFREPGYEQHETIKEGLDAAEKGGFTGVAVMPSTFPVADNSGLIETNYSKS